MNHLLFAKVSNAKIKIGNINCILTKSSFNCWVIYRNKNYIPIAFPKALNSFFMDSKEDKTMQTASIMNIIFKYNSKYTKYVSSGCLQKKNHEKYEWQHFVRYQKTKTGFNGLYQTVKTWLKHILFVNQIRHMHGLPVLCEVFPPTWRLRKNMNPKWKIQYFCQRFINKLL